MSKESWEDFEAEALANGELFVGCRTGGLSELEPCITSTVALNTDGSPIPPERLLFATRSLQLAIFAGSVWSKDGWSGWHTFEDECHMFFAAPSVLEAALKVGGYVCRVSEAGFEPGPLPGEYVSRQTVPVIGSPHPASILDMTVPVGIAAYFDPPPHVHGKPSPFRVLDRERIESLTPRDARHLGNGYEVIKL